MINWFDVFLTILVGGCIGWMFYRAGYNDGAKKILREWRDFNVQMFGPEKEDDNGRGS